MLIKGSCKVIAINRPNMANAEEYRRTSRMDGHPHFSQQTAQEAYERTQNAWRAAQMNQSAFYQGDPLRQAQNPYRTHSGLGGLGAGLGAGAGIFNIFGT